MRKRKGVARIGDGDSVLSLDLYEGKHEEEFFAVLSICKDGKVRTLRTMKGRWVAFDRKKETAHLVALRDENTRQAYMEV